LSTAPNEHEDTSFQQFARPETPEGLAPLPTGTSQVSDMAPDTKRFNWLAYSFTSKLLKEYAVIGVAVWVVYMLVTTLVAFMKGLTELFTQAVYFKSAPVLMVKTIDWHILLLGGTLIISITTILMVMLRSVLASNAVSAEEKKQHSSWEDMPLASFASWIVEQIKSRFK
jgi:hypothetical protein